MQLANTTVLKSRFRFVFTIVFLAVFSMLQAQDNSPYSRYALGNLYPNTNIINRGMGGIAAAYNDITSVNYSNPASYGNFLSIMEPKSGKVSSGRVILDVGVNYSSRSLTEPNTTKSFTSSDVLFSHVYVGIPIRKNWGLAFGIRPISRISYNIFRTERLFNPNSPFNSIDSVTTQFTGSGGSFLPTIGTGFGSDRFKAGFNVGYLFGRKEINTRRAFLNDTVAYAASDHTTNSSFGNIFFNAGIQYSTDTIGKENRNDEAKKYIVHLGASGNWKQTLNGSQDLMRQTYVLNSIGQELQVDSVYSQSGVAGKVIYPATYTLGFLIERLPTIKTRGWNLGVDYVGNQWNDFRFFGAQDLVKNNWELRLGGQLTPAMRPTRYGQTITYRFGVFGGPDYLTVDNKLSQYGLSFGMGLPVINYNRLSPGQFSVINVALEYSRRGNDQNKIREDLFRLSVGLNFTDLWFGKRKYD